jgi:hypothetical protein
MTAREGDVRFIRTGVRPAQDVECSPKSRRMGIFFGAGCPPPTL